MPSSAPRSIQFNIPGTASQVFTISPVSPLPSLENSIEIDGTSQQAFNGGTVVLSGAARNDGGYGLVLDASNCIVQGLVINGFRFDTAIEITYDASDCLIQNNFIGTNAAGTGAVSNGIGVEVFGDHNTISGNLVSGNQYDGILVEGYDATNNVVAGNFIGTDVTGLEVAAQRHRRPDRRRRLAEHHRRRQHNAGSAVGKGEPHFRERRLGRGDRRSVAGFRIRIRRRVKRECDPRQLHRHRRQRQGSAGQRRRRRSPLQQRG